MKAANQSGQTDRIALVTGAGVRLGRAVALALAGRGYDLALHCHRHLREAEDLAADARARGRRAEVFQVDLGDTAAVERLPGEVGARLGSPTALVLSASSWAEAPLHTLRAADVEETLRINLVAPLILGARFGLIMKERGQGSIVTMLDWSLDRPRSSHLPYEASKAGLRTVTLGLATALAPEVRVNGLALGAVLLPADAGPADEAPIRRATPLDRLGTPRDVVGAALYLLLDAPFCTGTVLTLDGGRSLW